MIKFILAAILTIVLTTQAEAIQYGKASWYALYSQTASGEMMNPALLTAAHRTLPFDTRVCVINVKNQKGVVVRINDRGPFIKGRIIDLSKGAAKKIDLVHDGVASVKVIVLTDNTKCPD